KTSTLSALRGVRVPSVVSTLVVVMSRPPSSFLFVRSHPNEWPRRRDRMPLATRPGQGRPPRARPGADARFIPGGRSARRPAEEGSGGWPLVFLRHDGPLGGQTSQAAEVPGVERKERWSAENQKIVVVPKARRGRHDGEGRARQRWQAASIAIT